MKTCWKFELSVNLDYRTNTSLVDSFFVFFTIELSDQLSSDFIKSHVVTTLFQIDQSDFRY